MVELKVKSKKYNDADELEVENFEEELSKNVGVALKEQNVIVKTLKQTEANWSANDVFDNISLAEGLVYEKKYARLEEINGVLYIVHTFTITNTTENSINAGIGHTIRLPREIAERIYDFDGKKVSEQNFSNISSDIMFYGSSTELYQQKVFSLRNSNVANEMDYVNVNATPIPANTTYRFTFRTFLTLI